MAMTLSRPKGLDVVHAATSARRLMPRIICRVITELISAVGLTMSGVHHRRYWYRSRTVRRVDADIDGSRTNAHVKSKGIVPGPIGTLPRRTRALPGSTTTAVNASSGASRIGSPTARSCQGGVDLVCAVNVAVGEVLEEVVGVETSSALTDLGNPRPNAIGAGFDRDRSCAHLVDVGDQVVSGQPPSVVAAACSSPAQRSTTEAGDRNDDDSGDGNAWLAPHGSPWGACHLREGCRLTNDVSAQRSASPQVLPAPAMRAIITIATA